MKPHQDLNDQFIGWYSAYADALFRHCVFRVYNRERARELMQESFMRVWEYVRTGKEISQPRALLYRIANNLVIDESRKRKASSLEELGEQGFEPSTGETEASHLQILGTTDEVRRLLAKLDENARTLILMRFVDGLTPKEIADALGETANVISVRLHRAVVTARQLGATI